MNSRKNPSTIAAILVLGLASISLAGCSSLFRRDAPSENEGNTEERPANSYSATEDGSEDLKDKKIQSLESTIAGLNTRIRELESKLQASQNRPALDARLGADGISARPERQNSGAVRPSVAASDPGAGFTNDASVRAFQQGKILFDQEKYPEAILAFSAFLERNEHHTLASTAQYYIGESYFREGDFTVADQEFQKLVLRHPNSARVSHSLVRLAECAQKTGRSDEARRYRLQAEGLYAKSPALREARILEESSDGQVPPIATAPDAPAEIANAATAPNLPIEKPVAPTAPTAPTVDSDLDAPPGVTN